ncbi:hypothetical protein bsdtw1_00252 [Clostridium fungisolvens]|uniref:Uncharacterized protein n=1 Tax=Clostridium fungisolvens TaxID=1604897 RepID=A0A6V8SAD0_9CLOT|nr:hypothetical protein bsdtw1_00252 [Clostridium fungisolvens]
MFFITVPIITVAVIVFNGKEVFKFIKLSVLIIIMMIVGMCILIIVSPRLDYFLMIT